jgi:hypothetical protein
MTLFKHIELFILWYTYIQPTTTELKWACRWISRNKVDYCAVENLEMS